MSDQDVIAHVKVFPKNSNDSVVVEDFTYADLNRIGTLIYQTVEILKDNVREVKDDTGLGLAEIQVNFGIDLEEGSKMPLVGPVIGTQSRPGAMFQVQVRIVRR
jgi:hypothetical protein